MNSPHNLSVNGPGAIKAASEQNLCVFCHTAHHSNGQTPLWNHSLSGVTNYIVYSSATLKAVVGQPDGASRLCLSCHDGTVALGMVGSLTSPIAMQNGVTTIPAGANNLGTDLSSDHPVSFLYNQNLVQQDSNLKDPATLTASVRLDHNGEMQCTACHDPHNDQFGSFLVMDNTASALCLTCHNMVNWSGSAHSLANKLVTQPVLQALGRNPNIPGKASPKQTTVASMGCESCHTSHQAGSRERLMRFSSPEQNCLICHGANMIGKDVASDFQKISVHPISLNNSAHSPNEDPINPPVRHVTCADCHNPHAGTATSGNSPNAVGSLLGVIGVSAGGAVLPSINKQYELCFRCHGDSIARGQSLVDRQFPETNKRLQFSPANQSFHPVEVMGRGPTAPSLIAPLTSSSLITCTDCHNSDQSPAAGGIGANGPHGSIYRPLLERQLLLTDFTPESPASYALCYKCHSRDSILNDQSFKYHREHIVDDKTACTTCHDSHGVANAAHLINFNTDYVTPASNGQLRYTSSGNYTGVCTLTCHGKDHVNVSYSPTDVPGSPALRLRKLR